MVDEARCHPHIIFFIKIWVLRIAVRSPIFSYHSIRLISEHTGLSCCNFCYTGMRRANFKITSISIQVKKFSKVESALYCSFIDLVYTTAMHSPMLPLTRITITALLSIMEVS
nr:hypothetical protein Iba_chr07aCG5040 [Ipomoea batatas]GMD19072.1 hypothetical protein Iba_chr07eCG5190 [Ipomoea batatas]